MNVSQITNKINFWKATHVWTEINDKTEPFDSIKLIWVYTGKLLTIWDTNTKFMFIFTDMGEGDWKIVENLEFAKTQRGRNMLCYEGFRYVTNQNSTKNIFWRCSHYVKFGCRASVVTSKDMTMLRYAGAPHSHEPDKQPKWNHLDIKFCFETLKETLTNKQTK